MNAGKTAPWLGVALCAVLGVAMAGEAAPTPAADPGMAQSAGAAEGEPAPYEVVCDDAGKCAVDKKTYIGWRTFHATCHQCHAQDAVGSTFAPSLLERFKTVDHERFVNSVRNGFQGQIGVMPPWKDDPNVAPHIEELYAYLRARADGVLPPGKPERLKK